MKNNYTCPACYRKDSLSDYYICLNCRKPGFMQHKFQKNPFYCSNCDLSWETLICPGCDARITGNFITWDFGAVEWIILVMVISIPVYIFFF